MTAVPQGDGTTPGCTPRVSRRELMGHGKENGTVRRSDGKPMCLCCCNGDRCDDRSHHDRPGCPHCHGTGALLEMAEWDD